MNVIIVYIDSGALSARGLAKDAEILQSTLTSLGHSVRVASIPRQGPRLTWWLRRLSRINDRIKLAFIAKPLNIFHHWLRRTLTAKKHNADLVIHLENVHPSYLGRTSQHWLIPNQEWFRTERLHYLSEFDLILCKTLEAQKNFRSYHPRCDHVSFSNPAVASLNLLDPDAKEPGLIVHVAGSSGMKGTGTLLTVWKQHPEWPVLTVIANQLNDAETLPGNIQLKSNLSKSEMENLWSRASVAILPSEVEGFGQVIIEAMAAGALVVTTDGPPMNELVDDDRGYLIPYQASASMGMGTRYHISKKALETSIRELLDAPESEKQRKIANARDWTKTNETYFKTKLEKHLAGS